MGDKKEYIERGAVLKTPPFTKFGGDLTGYDEGYLDCAEEARKAVNDAPAADVVEVVRCKDCKYFVSEVCRHDLAMNLSRGDDFCSYGERKE